MKKRIAVLASGRGSNFQAIIDAINDGRIPAVCERLFTDNPAAFAIERARNARVPVTIIDFASYPSRDAYEQALLSAVKDCNPDLIALAGYMRIVGKEIVRAFAGRMINIHPALLPAFPGLHGPRQALRHGVKVAGCTVHFVDDILDGGPIIVQRCVPVLEGDDEESLAARILEQEHEAFPEAIRLFCEGRLSVAGRHVIIS